MYEQPNQHKTSRIVSTLITIVVIAFVAFILWWLYQNFFATPSKPNTNATTQPSATNMSDKDFTAKLESALKTLGYSDKYVKLSTANWATTPQQGNILISGSVTANSFIGNGSNLTNLNANNLNSGIISTNLLPGSGSITCPSGVGNLTGGGNQATLGGAACGAISTITNPTFSQVTSSNIDTNNLNTTNLTTTNLTTNNLNAQTIATSNINANTITGTNLNIANISSTGNVTANSFYGDGANLTNLNANNITSGTLAVTQGGTGTNSFTLNGILYGNGTGALQVTAASTGANQCLITSTAGGAPSWGSCTAGGGVTTVGVLNGGTANANGATISGNIIYLQSASATNAGLVDTTTQTLAGAKTFSGNLTVSGAATLTVGTGATNLGGTLSVANSITAAAGINSSSTNAIVYSNSFNNLGFSTGASGYASFYGFQTGNDYISAASYGAVMGINQFYNGTNWYTKNGYIRPSAVMAEDGALRFYTSNINQGGTPGNFSPVTRMYIDRDGNVGIGTTSPATKLEVSGGNIRMVQNQNSGSHLQLYNTDAGNIASIGVQLNNGSANTYLRTTGSGVGASAYIRPSNGLLQNDSAGLDLAASGASGVINFWTGGSNQRMTITSAGNVGIGTTAPSHLLQVAGSSQTLLDAAGFYNTYAYGSGNVAETRINLGKIENGGLQSMGAIGAKPTSDTSSTEGALSFYTRTGGALTTKMTILNNGNVGIGTTSPSYLLHVGSSSVTTGTSVAQFENAGGTCTITPSTAGGISCTSDERLKKDITKLDTTTTLNKLLGISTISYHMNNDTSDSPLKVGFSAQQLESILPDLVVTGADGYKSVSYAGLTPYLVAGLQAQQQTINSLKQDIQTLQAATGINSNQVTIANLNVSGPTTLKDLTVTGNLNITGNLTLAGTLTVKDLTLTSNLTIGGHIITAGNTPTITPQVAAGQGATATIEGNDTSGVITIVAGSDATIGDVIDTTFAQQFGNIPKVILTPVGPESAKIQAYVSSPSAGSFKVGSVLAPTAGTTYTFNYQIMQ